jgi:hypothetical protein
MKQRDFANWLADVLREYEGPADDVDQVDVLREYDGPADDVDRVDVIDFVDSSPAVGVRMRDGSRFLLDIEAVDE